MSWGRHSTLGVMVPKHTHPGNEIMYVLEGTLEYQVEGRAPITLGAGEVLFVPSGAIHAANSVWAASRAQSSRPSLLLHR